MFSLENDNNNSKISYQQGDILSITIAPDDHLQFFGLPKRYSSFADLYKAKIARIFAHPLCYDYWLRIELSEPIGVVHQCGGARLHLHGILILKEKVSVYRFLLDHLTELCQHARLEINHIKSAPQLEGWVLYCEKQKKYMPTDAVITNCEIKNIIIQDTSAGPIANDTA